MNRFILLNYLSIASALLVSTHVLQSANFETTPQASIPTAQWKFELKNKDRAPIFIQIKEKNLSQQLLSINESKVAAASGPRDDQAGYLRIANLQTSKAYLLYIWKTSNESNYRNLKDVYAVYEISANQNRKIILLTYENNNIRPQKGSRLKGALTGTGSSSGLSLFGNITNIDLIEQSPENNNWTVEIKNKTKDNFGIKISNRYEKSLMGDKPVLLKKETSQRFSIINPKQEMFIELFRGFDPTKTVKKNDFQNTNYFEYLTRYNDKRKLLLLEIVYKKGNNKILWVQDINQDGVIKNDEIRDVKAETLANLNRAAEETALD